nr:C1-like protein [Tanacetum cinerariifolium]
MYKEGFNACSNCFLVESVRNAELDAIKEEASIKLKHKSHPQHSLTLKLRPASFCCDACKTEEKDLFYECENCDFWIHKSCASLAPTIHLPRHHPKHPLVLVYSLPENFYKYPNYCKFCNKYIRRGEWLYHCRLCRYFAHIKCALNAQKKYAFTPRDDPSTSSASDDVHSLLHFPMSEAFTDPLKLLHSKILAKDDKETTEFIHWSHPAHPLILNVEDLQGNNMMPDINSGDPIKDCDFQLCIFCAMRSPLSLAHRYCKGHEIPLTYPPVDDHPEDFYCDICEEEMDPNLPLYHCQKCKYRNSFHLHCISRIDYYANIWLGGTRTRAYHKHPSLTFVRRKKTPKYGDIRGSKKLKLKGCGIV